MIAALKTKTITLKIWQLSTMISRQLNKKLPMTLMMKMMTKNLAKLNSDTETKEDQYEGFAFLQKDVLCSIQDKPSIPKSWILLDSQSIVDVFSNPRLLNNIQDAKWTLNLHCNSSKAIITKRVI